jgi:hypothetical protein
MIWFIRPIAWERRVRKLGIDQAQDRLRLIQLVAAVIDRWDSPERMKLAMGFPPHLAGPESLNSMGRAFFFEPKAHAAHKGTAGHSVDKEFTHFDLHCGRLE